MQNIKLSDDLRTIKVEPSIKSDMRDVLREGTQFWLVTPKASLAGISGLDAPVGGNYIGMMPGKGNEQTHFTALDTQPKYRVNTGELLVHLQADNFPQWQDSCRMNLPLGAGVVKWLTIGLHLS